MLLGEFSRRFPDPPAETVFLVAQRLKCRNPSRILWCAGYGGFCVAGKVGMYYKYASQAGYKMRNNRNMGFTIVEIMIVVAIVGVLSAMATPYYLAYRERSHRIACMRNMQKIQQAKELYGMHSGGKGNLTWNDILPYLQSKPNCPSGGEYKGLEMGDLPYCTFHDWRNNPVYEGFSP